MPKRVMRFSCLKEFSFPCPDTLSARGEALLCPVKGPPIPTVPTTTTPTFCRNSRRLKPLLITRDSLRKSLIQTPDLRLRQTPAGSQAVLFGPSHAIRFGDGNDMGSRGAPVERDLGQGLLYLGRYLL